MLQEKKLAVLIKSIQEESPNVKHITLTSTDGSYLPRFSGGAHIKTFIKHKESTIERHYSLINYSEAKNSYEIAVRLSDESRGGSYFWHFEAKIGELVEISYPKNYFPLSFRSKHHVFYGAGIGITPFLSMMAELKERGVSFELHYAAKSKEKCAFYSFVKKHFPSQCHFYFSEDNQRLQHKTLLEHRIGTHVYVCGPAAFITDFTNAARAYGYPHSSIHSEHFTASKPQKASSFQVILRAGKTINVPQDKTLLDTLLEAGIAAPHSCKVGRCGTCELNVKHGEVEHYDSFLSEEQKESHKVILTCVSRAKNEKIVLDY